MFSIFYNKVHENIMYFTKNSIGIYFTMLMSWPYGITPSKIKVLNEKDVVSRILIKDHQTFKEEKRESEVV